MLLLRVGAGVLAGAGVGGQDEDEKQNEHKPLRTRRELATTTPARVLSRGIEIAKTENRAEFSSEFEVVFEIRDNRDIVDCFVHVSR